MRAQLAVPNNTLISSEHYNELLTMHGTTMIFLFVVPVMAGFGNYFVPLMIGARDMAFPRLNALSFWLLLLGGIVFYATLFCHPPEAGWWSYPPLSSIQLLPERRPGRVDLPDPHHRHLLAARRDQLLRDDRQHARARDELGPAAAVHLVDPGLRDPADHRAAGRRRRGDDAADRPALRHPLLRPDQPRLAGALAAPVLVLRAPRGLHHDPARASGSSPRSSRCSRASRSSATRRSPPRRP